MQPGLKRVLFLCADNCSRSQFAESILRKDGGDRFLAFSAGSRPGASVHPMALDVLISFGYPVEGLWPKNWFSFGGEAATPLDFVLTVCEKQAPKHCPVFQGQPESARWPILDPAEGCRSNSEMAETFVKTFYEIKGHVDLFLALPLSRLDRFALSHSLEDIHRRALADEM